MWMTETRSRNISVAKKNGIVEQCTAKPVSHTPSATKSHIVSRPTSGWHYEQLKERHSQAARYQLHPLLKYYRNYLPREKKKKETKTKSAIFWNNLFGC